MINYFALSRQESMSKSLEEQLDEAKIRETLKTTSTDYNINLKTLYKKIEEMVKDAADGGSNMFIDYPWFPRLALYIRKLET